MKTITLFTGLFMLSVLSYGQNLFTGNRTWNVVKCINMGGCTTRSFKTGADTLIGQQNHKTLYVTDDTTFAIWNLYAAVREENEKVYLYNFYLQKEEVLYDFGLNIGDTFSTTVNIPEYGNCPVNMPLISIDTVMLENGTRERRFTFENEQWISGVGSLNGLVYTGINQCVVDISHELSCLHDGWEIVYQSPDFDECIVNSTGYGETEEANFSVYPNPFYNEAKFTFDSGIKGDFTLEIINETGQIVAGPVPVHSKELSLGKNLIPGIYFYRLVQNGKVLSTGKLIKAKIAVIF